MMDMFGNRQASVAVDLPTRINSIIDRLSPHTFHTAISLINNHTLFPLYRPFLPLGRVERIELLMKGELGKGNVHMSAGQTACRIPATASLRFCVSCRRDDERKFGEPYWHRSHQAQWVSICSHHFDLLVDSGVRVGNGNRQSLVPLEPGMMTLQQPLQEAGHFAHSVWLATAVHLLLNGIGQLQPIGLDELHRRYLFHLYYKGLASISGHLDAHGLLESFRKYYGDEFLADLHCSLPATKTDNWLLALVRKPRKTSHPLYHLLLIRFLGKNVEELLVEEVGKLRPFGRGPWPCLNPAASHYRRAVIGACTITRNSVTGVPVGTFACRCGFAYSRSGPDQRREDRTRIGRIVSMGHVWENRLLDLILTERKSFRAAARQLNVDTKTVQRYFEQLSCVTPDAGVCSSPDSADLESRRSMWQELREHNPDAGTKWLRQRSPAVYAWLYRHDRVWLQTHIPVRRKHTVAVKRVNWQERDRRLSGRIRLLVKRGLKTSERPVRITATGICKRLGEPVSFLRNLENLPLTRKVLASAVESKDAFAIRRLRLAAEWLLSHGESLAVWKLVRQAGLRSGYPDC
ncbi:MAG: hypothetical protein FIA91_11930, partial [Geobacter sp.]|nr:hypothetical protein [Geobacter sp.]